MLPVLEVSRLSSASSFYSAITQPLSIRYLASLPTLAPSSSSPSLFTTKPEPPPSTALSIAQPAITFGSVDSKKAFFQIRQVAPTHERPLRKSHIVLSANSLEAINDFHAAALKAYPLSAAVIGTRASLDSDSATTIGATTAGASLDQSDICARVTDFDGNIMEVAYYPEPYSYSSHYGGSTSSRHRSTQDLDYDYDSNRVLYYSPHTELYSPRSSSRSRYHEMPSYEYRYQDSAPSSSSRYHGGSGRTPTLRRSTTSTSAASYEVPSSSRYSTRESQKGMSTAGMFGMAAVGAVAGAAFTYSVMRSGSRSRSRSSRDHEYDEATVLPSFQRRSTFPDSYQEHTSSRYSGYDGMRGRSPKEGREVEEAYEYDTRGRLPSSRHYSSGRSMSASGSRARSEAAYDRAPLMISEAEIRGGGSNGSYISARRGSSGLPPHALSSSRRGSSFEYHADPVERVERDSYVSGARSHRTIRGSGSGGSRLPSTPPNASRSAPVRQSMSRSGSYMSARNVPLPPSGAGSSHAHWYEEDDDRYIDDNRIMYDDGDNDSVAPSDSISCVGSRGRSHRHRR
ncbi:hypothetical protein SEUCBS139899_010406 [Sporothrix eucalyptigena]|uniref:Uncharacterized protein n=1 Tax=Sporothrix eucalyptigena TaxID=1812306 RepID=A0ABP0BP51_9PEZI